MSFTNRFNDLMDRLGPPPPPKMAQLAGIDRTGISRLRSGGRIPKKDGSTAAKLSAAFRIYAEETHQTARLCEIVGCNADVPFAKMDAAITDYLFEEDDTPLLGSGAKSRNISYTHFADRLNTTMEICGISNTELAKQLHMDASQISRYRNGRRALSSSHGIDPGGVLIQALYSHVRGDAVRTVLSDRMGIPCENLTEDTFGMWLLETDDKNSQILFAEGLLKLYESYGQEAAISLPSYEEIADTIPKGTSSAYYGVSGIRNAVLRFLREAIDEKDASELLLYSDQPMEWMTQDPGFFTKWAVLMSECVKRRKKIRIIHNINRSLEEMGNAISDWLPLYMSGMVESYYSKRNTSPRFMHTVFLCPRHSCVWGFNSLNCGDENTMYQYLTDEKGLMSAEAAFQSLLKESSPLIIPYVDMPERKPEEDDIVLDGNPFPNVRIRISSRQVIITPKKRKNLSFGFSHPLMCRAFREYAQYIR
ncbi:MAG: hypothetical protein K5853_03680 [Lachnospiraceae bacterium]|nr:hypothetical protein [Lachnospiraceae bacterium]